MATKGNKILSQKDCQILMTSYLQNNKFELLHHEEEPFFICTNSKDEKNSYFVLKVFIAIQGKEKHLRFLAKHSLDTTKEAESYKNLSEFRLKFLPKFYCANGNVLLLEDLSEQNFVLPNNPHNMNPKDLELILGNLAQYHVSCMSSEEKGTRQRKIADLETLWFTNKLKLLNDLLGEMRQESLKDKLAKLTERIKNTVQLLGKFLCHGLLWENSILLKYDQNGNAVDCKLLNLELQCHGNPTEDVLDFLYRSTTPAIRQKYLHELLRFYYETLQKEMAKKNLDIDQILPLKSNFEVSIHKILPLVKLRAICYKLFHEMQQQTRFSAKMIPESTLKELIPELTDLVTNFKLTKEDCYKIIEKKIKSSKYELLTYKLEPLGRVSGYLGDHNKLIIKILQNQEEVTLNFFAKFVPSNQAAMRVVLDSSACYKEIFFFEKLISMLGEVGVKLMDEIVVPCYFTRHNDVVIFEDLDIHGYSSLDPRTPLEYDLVCMIIKKFAKFHASSIILEERLGKKMGMKYRLKEQYPMAFQESFFVKVENHMGAQNMQAGINAVEHIMSLYSKETANEVKIKIKKAFERLYELVKESKKFRNVICHGDLWATNVLVKFDGDKPLDCRFIDFQLYRYCPPAHDILLFLHLTTNRIFRQRYQKEMLDLYYGSLSQNLDHYGFNIESIIPRGDFAESVDYMLPQAVCQTIIYFQLALINQEVMKEYVVDEASAERVLVGDRREFISKMHDRDPLFRERLGESVQDLQEMCLNYF